MLPFWHLEFWLFLLQVAIICNHQRSISKSHSAQMSRLTEKITELKVITLSRIFLGNFDGFLIKVYLWVTSALLIWKGVDQLEDTNGFCACSLCMFCPCRPVFACIDVKTVATFYLKFLWLLIRACVVSTSCTWDMCCIVVSNLKNFSS